jgi:hypothetical protein
MEEGILIVGQVGVEVDIMMMMGMMGMMGMGVMGGMEENEDMGRIRYDSKTDIKRNDRGE